MKILVTGGAGYIGSHTVIALIEAGHDVVVIDNLSNSNIEAHRRVEKITGRSIAFIEHDVRDEDALDELFAQRSFDGVIHFAGLKAVGESVDKPLEYYHNNLVSTLVLLQTMQKHNVKKFVFSSSATVYGVPKRVPVTENMPARRAINPYGQTKVMIEQILRDVSVSDHEWQITMLRYFNPVGAHESGDIGEDPNDIPNNLMPYITQVAVGKLKKLTVHGDDYDTPDGTGVRDYIHVVDLAAGHVAALDHLPEPGVVKTYNLGTGRGTSVLEMVKAFEEASGQKVPYEVGPRREGDAPTSYADPSLAEHELEWKAEKTMQEACADSWRWQSQNPDGYKS